MSDLILVLDDELSYATMVSDLLTEHGYQTDVCTQPREALERLHQKSYGLIISDFKMPGIDGAEFLLEVRKVLAQTPVMMISGLMGKPDLLKVANIGVTLVLEKPFKVPAFLEAVARYVHPSGEDAGGRQGVPAADLLEAVDASRVYPRPLRHLVDESAAMRQFLGGLWERVQAHAHVMMLVPPGGEFEAIARECCVWLEFDDSAICRVSTPELDRPEVREAIKARALDPVAVPLVAVGVPDRVELDLAVLERFLQWTREEPVVRARLRFLHALPDVIEARQFVPSAELGEAVSTTLSLPPLRDRLVDLGTWVRRELAEMGAERARPFSAAAVEMLLQYDWPGNHRELLSIVRRAVAFARRGEVTEAAIQLALRDRHQEGPPMGQSRDLAGFLLGEQRRFLQQQLPPKNAFEALGKLVGGRFERLMADRDPLEQPLLFEELTQPGGGC
jgi:DNA-binding NtrC family response regulator